MPESFWGTIAAQAPMVAILAGFLWYLISTYLPRMQADNREDLRESREAYRAELASEREMFKTEIAAKRERHRAELAEERKERTEQHRTDMDSIERLSDKLERMADRFERLAGNVEKFFLAQQAREEAWSGEPGKVRPVTGADRAAPARKES